MVFFFLVLLVSEKFFIFLSFVTPLSFFLPPSLRASGVFLGHYPWTTRVAKYVWESKKEFCYIPPPKIIGENFYSFDSGS